MTEIKKIVYGMLTENTGKAMCDSGGTDGRGWQKNQTRTLTDFNNESEERYEFDYKFGEVYRTVSVFHYLTNNLEIDDICEEFNDIQKSSDDWNAKINSYGVSEKAYERLLDEELTVKNTWNTYNGDSDLSQILQGSDLTINDEQYVLIQIHNGADARGGYTDAKLFKRGAYCEYMIHEYLREYKDSYDINEDIEEGYIENFTDYWNDSKSYTCEEVKNRLNELKTK
jgi:hypothetical protein